MTRREIINEVKRPLPELPEPGSGADAEEVEEFRKRVALLAAFCNEYPREKQFSFVMRKRLKDVSIEALCKDIPLVTQAYKDSVHAYQEVVRAALNRSSELQSQKQLVRQAAPARLSPALNTGAHSALPPKATKAVVENRVTNFPSDV